MEIAFTKGEVRQTFDGDYEVIIKVGKGKKKTVEAFYSLVKDNDKLLVAKVDKKRKKRSLDANSYMWVLCTKIAEKTGVTREESYRHHIRENGIYDDILLSDKAVENYISRWSKNGVGWFAEVSHRSKKVADCTVIRVYYGSSSYNSAEMARLIDSVVCNAKDLDIETMTPREIEKLKNMWGKSDA